MRSPFSMPILMATARLPQRFHRVAFCLLGIVAFANPAICSAQLGDIFENALEKVSGFNAWVSGSFVSSSKVDDNPMPTRFAFSLKYGPFGIGGKEERWNYLYVERTYTPLPDTVCNGDTCTRCLEEIDSSYFVDKGDEWETEQHSSLERIIDSCLGCCSRTDTFLIRTLEPRNQFTLTFGYSYAPEVRINPNPGFTTSFPVSGFFVQGLVRPFKYPKWVPDWIPAPVLGIGGSLLSMGTATGTLHDTSVVSFQSGLVFAPQVSLGIAVQVNGIALFGDVGYEYARFGGLSYTVPGEEGALKGFYADLPKTLNLSNVFLRLGVSLTTSSK